MNWLREVEDKLSAPHKNICLSGTLKSLVFPEAPTYESQHIQGIFVSSMKSWDIAMRLGDYEAIRLQVPDAKPWEQDIIDKCVSMAEKHIVLGSKLQAAECVIQIDNTHQPFMRSVLNVGTLMYNAILRMNNSACHDYPKSSTVHANALFEFRKVFDPEFEVTGVATIDKKNPFNLLRIKLADRLCHDFRLVREKL